MDNGDQFHTSDLGEASYLMAVGHACLDIRPVDVEPGRYRFCFPSEAARAVEDFYRGGEGGGPPAVADGEGAEGTIVQKTRRQQRTDVAQIGHGGDR